MAGVTAHGATFTFAGYSATVAGISVETPTVEVADMSGMQTPANHLVLVPTGAIASPGSITVDFISTGGGTADWQSRVGVRGILSLRAPDHAIVRNVLLESASAEARAGEIVRGSLRFKMTDYYG